MYMYIASCARHTSINDNSSNNNKPEAGLRDVAEGHEGLLV